MFADTEASVSHWPCDNGATGRDPLQAQQLGDKGHCLDDEPPMSQGGAMRKVA